MKNKLIEKAGVKIPKDLQMDKELENLVDSSLNAIGLNDRDTELVDLIIKSVYTSGVNKGLLLATNMLNSLEQNGRTKKGKGTK